MQRESFEESDVYRQHRARAEGRSPPTEPKFHENVFHDARRTVRVARQLLALSVFAYSPQIKNLGRLFEGGHLVCNLQDSDEQEGIFLRVRPLCSPAHVVLH